MNLLKYGSTVKGTKTFLRFGQPEGVGRVQGRVRFVLSFSKLRIIAVFFLEDVLRVSCLNFFWWEVEGFSEINFSNFFSPMNCSLDVHLFFPFMLDKWACLK